MIRFIDFLLESSEPYLKPAIRYAGKTHVGQDGEWHDKMIEDRDLMDVYHHVLKGFRTHKHGFLDRANKREYQVAIDYGHEHGLIHPKQNYITSDDLMEDTKMRETDPGSGGVTNADEGWGGLYSGDGGTIV